jgi:ferritin-like metal-binding protein YciE
MLSEAKKYHGYARECVRLGGRAETTKNQIARLDQVFKKLGQQPQGVQCPAIDGLISEADEVAGEVEDRRDRRRTVGRAGPN